MRRVILFFIFANVFNVWFNKRHLYPQKKKRMPLKKLVKESEIWTNADETKPNLPLEIKITAKLYINPMKLPGKSHLEGEKQGTVRLHDLYENPHRKQHGWDQILCIWLHSRLYLRTHGKVLMKGKERKCATERPRHPEKGISRA